LVLPADPSAIDQLEGSRYTIADDVFLVALFPSLWDIAQSSRDHWNRDGYVFPWRSRSCMHRSIAPLRAGLVRSPDTVWTTRVTSSARVPLNDMGDLVWHVQEPWRRERALSRNFSAVTLAVTCQLPEKPLAGDMDPSALVSRYLSADDTESLGYVGHCQNDGCFC
jgi:hypothetical protein